MAEVVARRRDGDHDPVDWVITMRGIAAHDPWNGRSRCRGMTVHNGVAHAQYVSMVGDAWFDVFEVSLMALLVAILASSIEARRFERLSDVAYSAAQEGAQLKDRKR